MMYSSGRFSVARVLAVVAVVATLGSVAVACALGAATSDPVPQSVSQSALTSGGGLSALVWRAEYALEGLESVSLSEGLSLSSPAIKLPPESITRPAVKVALLSEHAENPQAPSKSEQGVAVLYPDGIVLYAQPLGTVEKPQYRARQAQPDPDELPWEDGRAQAFTVKVVNGRDTAVQPGGVQVGAYGNRYTVYPAVEWVDGDVQYLLKSDTADVNRLLEIAESIK